MDSPPGRHASVNGEDYLYFCGTGYLGLQGDQRLIEASCEAARRYGTGTATSRTGYGTSLPVSEVEERFARLWRGEDAFYFASGYLGAQVVLAVLAKSADVILVDEHSHYSIIDATKGAVLPVVSFAHNDASALQEVVRKNVKPSGRPLVMCDGVFASSGDLAPVGEYLEALQEFNGSMLCLDESHAYGVMGSCGRGVYEQGNVAWNLVNQAASSHEAADEPRLYSYGTLSKAFGGFGGIVAGSRDFIHDVRTASGCFGGASAPPTPIAAATAAGVEIVATTPELVTRLQENARSFRQQLRSLGLEVEDTAAPIVRLTPGSKSNMQRVQQAMADDGILIAYMSGYSGLGVEGGLRIAVFATHTEADLRDCADALSRHL